MIYKEVAERLEKLKIDKKNDIYHDDEALEIAIKLVNKQEPVAIIEETEWGSRRRRTGIFSHYLSL